mmetsp:Transcript_6127/g.38042  ORF Transcript_6127/g.38042 Transcript_6127/m.38042 type:complete len:310 (-) Transcript_6127:1358-2287(-)
MLSMRRIGTPGQKLHRTREEKALLLVWEVWTPKGGLPKLPVLPMPSAWTPSQRLPRGSQRTTAAENLPEMRKGEVHGSMRRRVSAARSLANHMPCMSIERTLVLRRQIRTPPQKVVLELRSNRTHRGQLPQTCKKPKDRLAKGIHGDLLPLLSDRAHCKELPSDADSGMLDLWQRGAYCNRVSLQGFSVVKCRRKSLASMKSHLLINERLHGILTWSCASYANCGFVQQASTRGVFRSLAGSPARTCPVLGFDRKAELSSWSSNGHPRSMQKIIRGRECQHEPSFSKGQRAHRILCHMGIMANTRAFKV